MSADMMVDWKQWKEAIFYREETTNKALPEILNEAGGNVALRAAQFTPVGSKAQIIASLKKDPHLLAALTSLRLRGTRLNAPEFAAAMKKYEATRTGGWKYLRSGWAPCARALGKKFKGGVNQKAEDAYAGKNKIRSSAKPATARNLRTLLTWITVQPNAAKQAGAEKIAGKALTQAINFVSADMIEHAQEKLAKLYA